MILDRIKNTKKNVFWGWLNKIIGILLPFVLRTLIIHQFGIVYLGLNSLFTSVLTVLSLAELGFDSAIVFIMYEEIAIDNHEHIKALLLFIKRAYYIIGSIILFLGLCVLPFVRYFIKDIDQIPDNVNLYYVYIVFLMRSVISYFFGGYKNSLLVAFQRNDIQYNINSLVAIISFLLQAVCILVLKDYYYYLFTLPLATLFVNLLTVYSCKKKFPEFVPQGAIGAEEHKRIRKYIQGIFYAKLGGVLSVAFDNIIISSFLGIAILGYYSNYILLTSSIRVFLVVIYTSMQGGIGNAVHLDSVEKNFNDLIRFTFLYEWIVGFCFFCFVYLFQPFISLWLGKEALLPNFVMFLICIDFYTGIFIGIIGTYKSAIGIVWEDRYRCLVGGIFNLCINIFSVLLLRKLSVYYALAGVILSTILSTILITAPWEIYITFKLYFKKGFNHYILSLLKYFSVSLLCICISYPVFYFVKNNATENAYVNFLIRILLCILCPNIFFYFIYHKSTVFKDCFIFFKQK